MKGDGGSALGKNYRAVSCPFLACTHSPKTGRFVQILGQWSHSGELFVAGCSENLSSRTPTEASLEEKYLPRPPNGSTLTGVLCSPRPDAHGLRKRGPDTEPGEPNVFHVAGRSIES